MRSECSDCWCALEQRMLPTSNIWHLRHRFAGQFRTAFLPFSILLRTLNILSWQSVAISVSFCLASFIAFAQVFISCSDLR
jgi:hypothetical protein